jgi:hypothetical protein
MTENEERGYVAVQRKTDEGEIRFPLDQYDDIMAYWDGTKGARYTAIGLYGELRSVKVAEIAEVTKWTPDAVKAFLDDAVELKQDRARLGLD